MSDTIITVENLSKRYLVGHEAPRESYQSMRDTLARHGRNFARKTLDMATGRQIIQGDSVEEFWALKDVSFDVKRGEVLGIIGRNGAGKSTLLKVLSRITEPTKGRVTLNGRVASLLEVGTGFHPELSGRENIFLNGAILGMTRAEIRAKFDEIVEFAGVEKFLDTPVKRYSSGMYVRLAFAVAAHLEPEILIVDEVLAVGDAEFQKKCLGKMKAVAKGGRTVVFVSHNLSAIRELCSSSLYLKSGTKVSLDTTSIVLSNYLDLARETQWERSTLSNSQLSIEEAAIVSDPASPNIILNTKIRCKHPTDFSIQVRLSAASGTPAAFGISGASQLHHLSEGLHEKQWSIAGEVLALGRYTVTIRLTVPGKRTFDNLENIIGFEFLAPPPPNTATRIEQDWGLGYAMVSLDEIL